MSPQIGSYVITMSSRNGVHYGRLVSMTDDQTHVVLTRSRRLWVFQTLEQTKTSDDMLTSISSLGIASHSYCSTFVPSINLITKQRLFEVTPEARLTIEACGWGEPIPGVYPQEETPLPSIEEVSPIGKVCVVRSIEQGTFIGRILECDTSHCLIAASDDTSMTVQVNSWTSEGVSERIYTLNELSQFGWGDYSNLELKQEPVELTAHVEVFPVSPLVAARLVPSSVIPSRAASM